MTVSTVMAMPTKAFKVIAISSNRGPFGHNEMILVAEDGQGFRVKHIQGGGHEVWKKGDVIKVPFCVKSEPPFDNGDFVWSWVGVECPAELPKAPDGLVQEVWS